MYYDYPVIHHCVMNVGRNFTALDAYQKTDQIINHTPFNKRFDHRVWDSDMLAQQIDYLLINHFDNIAKTTRLKELEFNMRSRNIGDLPVKPGENVPLEMIDDVITYNCHDVDETVGFAWYCRNKVEFREELSKKYDINMLNYNDTKIGKKYFEIRLEQKQPGITGTFKEPRQTKRDHIKLGECILPIVEFKTSEFNRILNYYRNTTVTETKNPPEMKDLVATLDGFEFHFGMGGMHGSLSKTHVSSTPGWTLVDIDVASYYPNLAIKFNAFPEHLGMIFCETYSELYHERKQHPKKTAPNEMFKLALNGVYGDSNNKFSAFYDPKYTMTITINGQMLLCMLAEEVMTTTGCKMVQINTDGITVLVPDADLQRFRNICSTWESKTGLELEEALYSDMWIRDVNNYIARFENGKLKRIGAYAHETARENEATREVQWHKDHSALVVQKAAEAHMVHGTNIEQFIKSHTDAFDFFVKAKCPRGSRLELADGTPCQGITRYYISHNGQHLFKFMPPLKGKEENGDRRFAINKGWSVTIADNLDGLDLSNLNYDWYIQEAEKLVVR